MNNTYLAFSSNFEIFLIFKGWVIVICIYLFSYNHWLSELFWLICAVISPLLAEFLSLNMYISNVVHMYLIIYKYVPKFSWGLRLVLMMSDCSLLLRKSDMFFILTGPDKQLSLFLDHSLQILRLFGSSLLWGKVFGLPSFLAKLFSQVNAYVHYWSV